jgi:hypothetical protein
MLLKRYLPTSQGMIATAPPKPGYCFEHLLMVLQVNFALHLQLVYNMVATAAVVMIQGY